MEHTSFDLRDIQPMVMAAERVDITPIVPTPGFDQSAATALEAVKAVRYPTAGRTRHGDGELGTQSKVCFGV